MGDVAIAQNGRAWLAGRNGTVWYTDDGKRFSQVDGAGFVRLSAGPDDTVRAVGKNGSLWTYSRVGGWVKTPANAMTSITPGRGNRPWAVGADGSLWQGP